MKESRIYQRLLISFLLFTVSCVSISCGFFDSKEKDFRESIPVGTFIGIGIPIEEGAEVKNKEAALEEPVKEVAESPTTPSAVPATPDKASEANIPASPNQAEGEAPVVATSPEPIKPKRVKSVYKGPKVDILINLFPMDVAYKQGVGILRINTRSYKFNWESDSINKNSDGNTVWNIAFSKDNNIYANLDENFNFTGILEQKDTGLELYGTLSMKPTKAEEMLNYHIQTYQHKSPIISASGELSVKAGESLTLEAEQSGFDKTIMQAYAESLDGKNKVELVINSLDKPEKGKKKNKLTIATDAAMVKGDYNVYIIRDEEFSSNSIKVTIQ
ncbi:MAG: hypothetical protein ACOYK1_04235 [Vampirovibrionia bacterium]